LRNSRRKTGLVLLRALERRAVDDHQIEVAVAVEIGQRETAAVDFEDVVLRARTAGGRHARQSARVVDEQRSRGRRLGRRILREQCESKLEQHRVARSVGPKSLVEPPRAPAFEIGTDSRSRPTAAGSFEKIADGEPATG
jgi:hypothetical protein